MGLEMITCLHSKFFVQDASRILLQALGQVIRLEGFGEMRLSLLCNLLGKVIALPLICVRCVKRSVCVPTDKSLLVKSKRIWTSRACVHAYDLTKKRLSSNHGVCYHTQCASPPDALESTGKLLSNNKFVLALVPA